MALPFKQEQGRKVKFKGQRETLPSLFLDIRWYFIVWVAWNGHSCMGIISYKGVWKMLLQQNGVLLIKKERMDTGWAIGLISLTLQYLLPPSS